MKRTHQLAEKEREKLERKLANVGGPLWGLRYRAKKLGRLGMTLYLLNAGIQTYFLVNSESYEAHVNAAQSTYVVGKDLVEDPHLQGALRLYIDGKRFTNQEFDQQMETMQYNVRRAQETRSDLVERVKRIYNPLRMFK